ncbi:MAG: hypothetical protein LAN62_11500 [Acidobacteriia bacterium]|nr:hypothetical protein [Terriglobia bacterium]
MTGRLDSRHRHGEEGQVTIFVVLAMALFLVGFVGFAVDMTNLWLHRQMAQGAADAACQAGAMNLYYSALGSGTSTQGFTIPSSPGAGSFDCTSTFPNDPTPGASPTPPSPCRYAALNGYKGGGLGSATDPNQVLVSFPAAVSGVSPPGTNYSPVPFIRVDVIDRVRLVFSPLITRRNTSDVRATATCGLALTEIPIPILVLNPVCAHSMEVSGSGTVKVLGGPDQSVQVNSDSSFAPGPPDCAAATTASDNGCTGNSAIDLSEAGENFTGSLFGTNGGQYPAPPRFIPGTTGQWSQHGMIIDPYWGVPPPDPSSLTPRTGPTLPDPSYGQYGCPDHSGCKHYEPGRYANSIVVTGETAIFDPGIYYIEPASPYQKGCGGVAKACTDRSAVGGQCKFDFFVGAGGVVRPSKVGDGGTMFFLSGQGGNYGGIFFDANAGKYTAGSVDDYYPNGSTATSVQYDSCPNASTPNPRALDMSAPLKGNVLFGMCTEKGSYPNPPVNPYGWTDQPGGFRGFIFFQDRANADPRAQPMLQGGGGLLLGGTMYFHNCPNSPTCQPYNTDWNAQLDLRGTPGSDTRVLGDIIADQLILGGNADIYMALDPSLKIPSLKVTMYR